MKVSGIDSSQIKAMMAQMKAAAQGPNAEAINHTIAPSNLAKGANKDVQTDKVDFSQALKSSLDKVNDLQMNSKEMGQKFVMGDESISLSDVMIAGQKSNISFQATVQVRNKLVSAYSEIMNMQV